MADFPIVLSNLIDDNLAAVPPIYGTPIFAKHINDLEAKVGIDGSAVVTTLDYLLKNPASHDPGHQHTMGSIIVGVLPVTSGGTGLDAYAVGDMLYASGIHALSRLADVAVGNVLISGGVGVAPSWNKVDLTAHVTGVLPDANGGTGAANAWSTAQDPGHKHSALWASDGSPQGVWVNANGIMGVGRAPVGGRFANMEVYGDLYASPASSGGIAFTDTVHSTFKSGYAAFDVYLRNPSAATPEVLLISFTLSGKYTDAGVVEACSFQLQQDFSPFAYLINSDIKLNLMFGNLFALGTSAQKNLAIGSGVAPTTAPADMASMWVADINAAVGKAGFHMMAESGLGSLVVSGAILKGTTGTPAQAHENLWCINSFDHTVKIYAEGSWKALPIGSSILPIPNGGTGQAIYAVGDLLYASATNALSRLADVAVGNVLLSGGVTTAPVWGKVGLTAHVTGILPTPNGGTGQGVYAVGDLLYASATNALSRLADVAVGQVLSSGGVGVAPAWAPRDGYTLGVHGASFDPADSQNYYFGCLPHFTPDTTATRHATRVQFAGTITNAFIRWYAGGVAGTGENVSVYIRLNNTTDYLIATVGDTNASKTFINDALSIAVAANDMIEIKIVTPAWVTNPTEVRTGGVLRIG